VKTSTIAVVGVAGVVALAAVASGVRSAIGGSDSGETGTTAEAPAASAAPTTTTLPIGDVRRLPPLQAGDVRGRLVLYRPGDCVPGIVDLASLQLSVADGMSPACNVWVSPGRRKLATILPPPEEHEVQTATAVEGPPTPSGVDYEPSNTGALTIADDGAVATCDGSKVILGRAGNVRTVRSFTPLDNGFDERCVTGAIGRAVVRLGEDRRTLVDVATGRVIRRLAVPARRSIIAIAASPDGLVLLADTEDGTPQGTVYGADGRVAIPRQPIGRGVTVRKVVVSARATAVALQTSRGWDITCLTNGRTLVSPGGARVTDVAFAPDASALAETTDAGVLIADVPDLRPRWFLDVPGTAVAWFPPG
jgi:hypothetical protein